MSVNIVNKSTGALTKIAGNPVEQASGISYDHTSSGMQANNVQAAVDELKSGLTNVNNNLAILNGETGEISGNSNVEITITSGDLLWLYTYRDNTQYTSAYIVGGTWKGTPSVAKIVESANITVEGLAGTPPYNTVKITNANSGTVNYKLIKISTP